MDRHPYYRYTILLGATRALAHIGVHLYTLHFRPVTVHMDEPYPTLHIDEVIHSTQGTPPNESDQLRQERHQGHSARSHAAHLDEFIYSGQVTLPEESDQLKLHCHSAISPLGLTARSHAAHLNEFVYYGQVTPPEESDQLGYIATRPQRPEPRSSP